MKAPRDHLPRQAWDRSKETLKKRPRVFSAGGSHHGPRADPGRCGLDRRAEREAARAPQPRSILHLADLPGKKTRGVFVRLTTFRQFTKTGSGRTRESSKTEPFALQIGTRFTVQGCGQTEENAVVCG